MLISFLIVLDIVVKTIKKIQCSRTAFLSKLMSSLDILIYI